MTHSSEQPSDQPSDPTEKGRPERGHRRNPERRPGHPSGHRVPRPVADLDVLRSHPSLTSLAGKGWLLDRLPTRSTAWAFTAALLISVLALGRTSTVVIIAGTALAVLLTASALSMKEVRAARVVLLLARTGLIVWVVSGVGMAWLNAPTGGTPSEASTGRSSTGAGSPAPSQAPATTHTRRSIAGL